MEVAIIWSGVVVIVIVATKYSCVEGEHYCYWGGSEVWAQCCGGSCYCSGYSPLIRAAPSFPRGGLRNSSYPYDVKFQALAKIFFELLERKTSKPSMSLRGLLDFLRTILIEPRVCTFR